MRAVDTKSENRKYTKEIQKRERTRNKEPESWMRIQLNSSRKQKDTESRRKPVEMEAYTGSLSTVKSKNTKKMNREKKMLQRRKCLLQEEIRVSGSSVNDMHMLLCCNSFNVTKRSHTMTPCNQVLT